MLWELKTQTEKHLRWDSLLMLLRNSVFSRKLTKQNFCFWNLYQIFLPKNRSLRKALFFSQSNLVSFSFKLHVNICLTVLSPFILGKFHCLNPKFGAYDSANNSKCCRSLKSSLSIDSTGPKDLSKMNAVVFVM